MDKSWIGHAIQALCEISILDCEIAAAGGCNSGWDNDLLGFVGRSGSL